MCLGFSFEKCQSLFACDDVPVIKRTRNARCWWLRKKTPHAIGSMPKTDEDEWSVGVSIPYCVSRDGRGATRVLLQTQSQWHALRTFRPCVGFTLCPHGLVHARHCGPFPRVPPLTSPPVDPGKGSRGNSKGLPNSDESERPHHHYHHQL